MCSCSRLFPATPGEYAEPYEMPEDFMVKMQEQAEASDPRGLMVFLAVLLAAAVCFLIYWIIKKRVLHWRIPVRPTVKSFPPRYCFRFRLQCVWVFRRIAVFFHSIFLLLFCPGQIPSLLIRADWYGKRHFHPRHRGETLREYLNRLCETADEEKKERTGTRSRTPGPVRGSVSLWRKGRAAGEKRGPGHSKSIPSGARLNSYLKQTKSRINTGLSSIYAAFRKEQITGIEPASPAWEAGVLPMNYICLFRFSEHLYYIISFLNCK